MKTKSLTDLYVLFSYTGQRGFPVISDSELDQYHFKLGEFVEFCTATKNLAMARVYQQERESVWRMIENRAQVERDMFKKNLKIGSFVRLSAHGSEYDLRVDAIDEDIVYSNYWMIARKNHEKRSGEIFLYRGNFPEPKNIRKIARF